MRYAAVGVLVAAGFGIHCSAPTEAPTDTSAPELVATAPPPRGSSPVASPVTEDDDETSRFKTSIPALAAMVHSGIAPRVTSSVNDETGALFVTGTFMGTVAIGNTEIVSRGDQDVFLLKLDPNGAFQWVRAVGSASVERSPKVALAFASNQVSVVGITHGEMDCGGGPMMPWTVETFFVCVFSGANGESTSSGVFPSGSP